MSGKKYRISKYLFLASIAISVLLLVLTILFPDWRYISRVGYKGMTITTYMPYTFFIAGIVPIISASGYLLILIKEKKLFSINSLGIILSIVVLGPWIEEMLNISSKTTLAFQPQYKYYLLQIMVLLWFGFLFDRLRYITTVNKTNGNN